MDTGWQQRLRRGARRLYTLVYATIADVKIGPHVIVMPGAVLKDDKGGSLTIGAGSVIHRGAMLLPYGGFIRIGRRCSVNPYCVLYGHGGLFVGDNVRIAAHCVIVPANHGIALDGGLIADQPLSKRGIRIGDNVWIGAGVRILDGADIGEGCVVAAGSVVRGRLEPNGIYAGVPAKLVRMRTPATTYLKTRPDEEACEQIQKAVAAS
jgi:acetyltransferase-like isoleucine patch superfamily enzyme